MNFVQLKVHGMSGIRNKRAPYTSGNANHNGALEPGIWVGPFPELQGHSQEILF